MALAAWGVLLTASPGMAQVTPPTSDVVTFTLPTGVTVPFMFPELSANSELFSTFFQQTVPATAFLTVHQPKIDLMFREPGGDTTPFSDLLTMHIMPAPNNQVNLSFDFTSDAPGVVGPPIMGGIVETGKPIDVTTQLFGAGNVAPFSVSVLSDLDAVPEPSSVVLAGIGALIGLGYWQWHRQRS